ncbi:MAG: hypothetical protein JM58_15360 [Peptococcaceae bacterium BICA1-8]|nr:MAG: hypothetical protein JM58_15360 [Peptococcaceae bacterium BICA1-8]
MRIGARTIKTGLAVCLTIFLINILEANIKIAEYNIAGMAAITAIIGIQPSIRSTLDTFKNRLIATMIGSVVAISFALTFGINPLLLGIASVSIILVCLKLGLDESIRFALITLVAVSTQSNEFDLLGVAYRIIGMFIGLIVATGLNVFLVPPNYTQDLKNKVNSLRATFENFYEEAISDILREENINKEEIKGSIQKVRDELEETRSIYSLLREDTKKEDRKELKKFKRSINAIQSNLERLLEIHRSIIFIPTNHTYMALKKDLSIFLVGILKMHTKIYDSIVLDKEYEEIEMDVNEEKVRRTIVNYIKETADENVFEFYNIYSEAERIKSKLEEIKDEFDI